MGIFGADRGAVGRRWVAAVLAVLGLSGTGAVQAETVVSVTQVSYDAVGRPECTAVRMNPDSFGNLPASACDLGGQSAYGPDRITKTVYDAAGQVVQVRQAVGTPVERVYSTFAYSPNGKVTDSIDANGNRTKMTYDGFDRLSAVYYPDTNRPGGWNPATQATALATAGSHSSSDYEAYAYDDNGNRSWWRRRDGNYIYYNYDNLNREILHYNPNGLIPHLYTTYDLTGKVLKKRFNDWNGPGVTYTYDGLGRLDIAADMNGRSLDYNYNQASARTGMWWPDGKHSFYALDGLNRVVYSDISNSGVAMCLGYDNLGRLSGRCWANNTSEGLGYDNQSRLTNLNYYFPDGSKNIYWGFAYNPANQITTLYANNTTQYDFRETQVQTDNRAFDGLNRDSGIAALSGGYDARGNMTNDGSRQMTYDLYNRLKTLTGNGQNLQMTYDPEGRLASYTVNGATTTFLYDGVKLIAEYDGSGNMQKRYLHGIGTDDPWAELTGSDVNSGNVKYLYANYQGSVFAQANGSGTVTDIYKYGPYGEPKNAADQTSFSGSRFRYTGQTVLPEAQLYYYKARVYDPIHGRFLQTDPIGSKDDLNLYGYVGGDPVNRSDPTGLSCERVGGAYDCKVDNRPENLTKAEARQLDKFEKDYTKAVNKLMSGPDKDVRIQAFGAKSKESQIFTTSKREVGRELIDRNVTYDRYSPGVADTDRGTTVLGPRGIDDKVVSNSIIIVHEGIHETRSENKMPTSFLLRYEEGQEAHQNPYNKAAQELLK